MHNAITEIKSTLEGTNSREPTVTEAEERISEMEDRMVEINEAGQRLTEFFQENSLIIINTLF